MIKETSLCAACGWATGGAGNNFRDSCCGIERCSRKGVLQFDPRLRGGERQWTRCWGVQQRAAPNSVCGHGPKRNELKACIERRKRHGDCALVLGQSALRWQRTRASVQTLYRIDNASAVTGVTFIPQEDGEGVITGSGNCQKIATSRAGVARWLGDASPAREVSGGTDLDRTAERVQELGGLETMQPEVKAADIMRYSTYATYRSETCSNQRGSTLQKPFSSASAADAIGDVLTRQAGEKASDGMECRAW